MRPFIITGCGTDVGKTVVSAIFVALLQGEYWKPIETGSEADSETVARLSGRPIHKPAYSFINPVSPHQAAQLENRPINWQSIKLPHTNSALVIETVGGILVPLSDQTLALDLFQQWEADWIVVSQNYLGSINHTLLTLEALKSRDIRPKAIIFNGKQNEFSERAIINFSKVNHYEQLPFIEQLDRQAISYYAKKWQKFKTA